jgi:hypothetical protein
LTRSLKKWKRKEKKEKKKLKEIVKRNPKKLTKAK